MVDSNILRIVILTYVNINLRDTGLLGSVKHHELDHTFTLELVEIVGAGSLTARINQI